MKGAQLLDLIGDLLLLDANRQGSRVIFDLRLSYLSSRSLKKKKKNCAPAVAVTVTVAAAVTTAVAVLAAL